MTGAPALRASAAELRLRVKVMPGSGKSQIDGERGGELVVRLCAAPERGKANRELLELLGRAAGVPRTTLRIVSGESSRHKVVALPLTARERIEVLLTATTGSRTKEEKTGR